MRIGSSTRFLAAFLASASALENQSAALLRIDLERFPDQVYEAACPSCCPVTIRTVLSTVISTVFQDRTEYVTATQHDVSTKLEYMTQFITKTATKTHASSYPVTITKSVGCHGYHYKLVDPSNPEGNAAEVQGLEGRTDGCHTTTVTEWITTTATRLVTAVESIIKTQTLPVTVPVPTTVHDTKTIIGSTTIWVPTTYVRTTTVISEHPVTRTVDNTIFTTRSTTVYTKMVSTVATSYPVISYITKPLTQTVTAPGNVTTITRPAETITRPGEIITKPAQTITKAGKTVTVPAQPSTVTLPAETQTVPGSTVVKTLTRTLPPTTVKMTHDQATRTIVQPGTTVTEVQTQTLLPSLITKPASTVTVTPVFNVTLCPTPTGATAPLSPTSDLTFGCKPGYVCNPPKPNGCNIWPEPPADDFLCDVKDCILSPPFTNTTWDHCMSHYYPPSYGYFNLDPKAFGLSYDIFQSQSYEKAVNPHTATVTSGDWEFQESLTARPKPTDTSRPVSPAVRARAAEPSELRDCRSKRDTTPAICFDDCNNAYVIALAQGKTESLCAEGSTFRLAFAFCVECIKLNSNATDKTIGDYVEPQFAQFINFCSGRKAGKPTMTTPDQPQSMVTTLPAMGTSTQADTSEYEFTPMKSTTTASRDSPAQSSTFSSPTSTSSTSSTPLTSSTLSTSSTPLTSSTSSTSSTPSTPSTPSTLSTPSTPSTSSTSSTLSTSSTSSIFSTSSTSSSSPSSTSISSTPNPSTSISSISTYYAPTSATSSSSFLAESSIATSAYLSLPISQTDDFSSSSKTKINTSQSSAGATSTASTSITNDANTKSQEGTPSLSKVSSTTALFTTNSAKEMGRTKDAESSTTAPPSPTVEHKGMIPSSVTQKAAANRPMAPRAFAPLAISAIFATLMLSML